MARRYALIVGISEYQTPLKPLSKPASDAEAVAAVLKQFGDFQDVTVLKGTVTSTKLIEALRTFLLERAKNNDILIYFTGHGIPVVDSVVRKPKAYLATSDTIVTLEGKQVAEARRAVPLDSLNDLIQESSLSSLVMLFDSCHSGDFVERSLVEKTFTAFSTHKDYYLITACRGFEQAYAIKRAQHSIFTGALLEGLSKPDEDGRVTGDNLSAFIKRELRGSGQEPISMGFGGTITLVSYGTQTDATQINEACPYQGLEPFTEATQQFFFGRSSVVEQLRQKLESTNFVALIGASGSGKSSVVRAGLIPQVREAGWRVLEPIKPGFDLLSELKRVFANQFHRRDEIQKVYEAIASASLDPIMDLLPGSERILLVVDQFEEVFTVCSDEQSRRSLINCITQIQESRLRVVITMRADFLEPCLDYVNLTQQLQQHTVLIPPLEGKMLEEAIAKPAEKQGYRVEPALLSLIQRDVVQEKNCLPLLQFALQSLWDSATQAGHQLKLEHYEQLNGIAGALNQHGDRIYDWQDWREASPTRPRNPQEQEWIKRLCLKLVRTGESTRDTRQRQPKADLLALAGEDAEGQAIVEAVLADLINGRLLVTDQETEHLIERSGSLAYVDLAHEALMQGWQRFADWRKDDRELRRLCDRMEDARREWEQHHRNMDFLLPKSLLVQAEPQCENLQPYLTLPLKEFYQFSKAQEQEREATLKRAKSEALAAQTHEVIKLLQREPLVGLACTLQLVKLNLEKTDRHLSGSTQNVLYHATKWINKGNPVRQTSFRHKTPVWSVVFSPDSQIIASSGEDGIVRLWNLEGRLIKQTFPGHKAPIMSVAFSPDGQTFVSGDNDGTLCLWNLQGNLIKQPFIGHKGSVMSVAFSPNGQVIASGSEDCSLRLWDLQGNSIGQPFMGHESFVRSIAFSPNGQTIVSGGNDGTLRLWNLQGSLIEQFLSKDRDWVMSVAFSPDGQTIVSGHLNGTLHLWASQGNSTKQSFAGHSGSVRSIMVSPDNQIIVSGGDDATLRLWDFQGNPVGQPFEGHETWVRSVAFSPNGQMIASGSADSTVRLWRTWQDWLAICCDCIRLHPYFKEPQTEEARAACEVCEKYVWSKEENSKV